MKTMQQFIYEIYTENCMFVHVTDVLMAFMVVYSAVV